MFLYSDTFVLLNFGTIELCRILTPVLLVPNNSSID